MLTYYANRRKTPIDNTNALCVFGNSKDALTWLDTSSGIKVFDPTDAWPGAVRLILPNVTSSVQTHDRDTGKHIRNAKSSFIRPKPELNGEKSSTTLKGTC